MSVIFEVKQFVSGEAKRFGRVVSVTYVQKNFRIRTLIKQLFTKYQILTKLPQISHFHIRRPAASSL